MTRSRVNLALIEDITERKVSYKKRQKGYLKKAQELSTLCDVETATVVYSPYHDEPKVFPNQEAVTNTFRKFRELPELEQFQNMETLEDVIKKRIKKLENQLSKVRKENRVKEFTNKMHEVLNGKNIPTNIKPYDLNDLSYVINETLKRVREVMKIKVDGEASTSNDPGMIPPVAPTTMASPSPLPMIAPSTSAPAFPPMTPLMDPSMNVPQISASMPMNNYQRYSYDYPQSPPLSEMFNWNDDVVGFFDDMPCNNNVQDSNNNNNI
ncbi:agamous-like MADS-box protein AGL80 [Lycium barbarum]|uniref:agamous-like MADS-box protein AGL80 n=1 Tax=Lycium barbarum TaxID=112863 RepID=UPI00293E6BB3|nr:agamous-like MADS-box protein AGL80 [Lycium barbarum]